MFTGGISPRIGQDIIKPFFHEWWHRIPEKGMLKDNPVMMEKQFLLPFNINIPVRVPRISPSASCVLVSTNFILDRRLF